MKKIGYFPYVFFVLCLFILLSLPQREVERCRSFSIACFSLPWRAFHGLREFLLNAPTLSERIQEKNGPIEELARLTLENQNLKEQLQGVYEWLLFDQRIEDQMETLKSCKEQSLVQEVNLREFFQRRGEELKKLLEIELQSLPAKVIYRTPSSWSSSLWLNVGEKDNEVLGTLIVAKNSPVLFGNALIGVVEYVDKRKCRVRLITDSGLIPSVRAIRGKSQDLEMVQLLDALQERITLREGLFTPSEKEELSHLLLQVKEKLPFRKDQYLAKGELQGSSNPLWRSRGSCLRGIGFNYDYPDQEGPARALRMEKILSSNVDADSYESLLQGGDLLITTGWDGVFPANLQVAFITKIFPVQEGAYAYDIEAKPCAYNLEDVSTVFVLPPQKID